MILKKTEKVLTHDLTEAKKRFAAWRDHRGSKRIAIPEELWEVAVDLTKDHSVGAVCQALGLNSNALRKKAGLLKADGGPKRSTIISKKSPKMKHGLEVVTLAPVHLSSIKSTVVANEQGHCRPSLIAEIVNSSGFSMRFFSGIDRESLNALSHLIEGA